MQNKLRDNKKKDGVTRHQRLIKKRNCDDEYVRFFFLNPYIGRCLITVSLNEK